MIICYTVPGIWRVTDVICVFFFLPSCAIFCLFTPQLPKKEKKTSGHINILHMCINNYDHMMTDGRTVGKSDI